MVHQSLPCPVFHPTAEEFDSPFTDYARKVFQERPELAMFKVVPPAGWCPRRSAYPQLEDVTIKTPIRQHAVGTQGAYRCIFVEHKPMPVSDFKRIADEEAAKHAGRSKRKDERLGSSADDDDTFHERTFWSSVTLTPPLYGADTPMSFFDEQLPSGWNMHNLGDLLKRYPVPHIVGVTSPMMYFGMWRSFFGWHLEDADLLSTNYLHFGAPKMWYAVSPRDRKRFDHMAQSLFPQLHRNCRAFVRHKDIMLSPAVLRTYNIPFVQAKQEAGQFVVLNAAAYHSGFNMGFNCAEAVNFATEEWVPLGRAANSCTCEALKDCVRIDMGIFDKGWDLSGDGSDSSSRDEVHHAARPAAVCRKRKTAPAGRLKQAAAVHLNVPPKVKPTDNQTPQSKATSADAHLQKIEVVLLHSSDDEDEELDGAGDDCHGCASHHAHGPGDGLPSAGCQVVPQHKPGVAAMGDSSGSSTAVAGDHSALGKASVVEVACRAAPATAGSAASYMAVAAVAGPVDQGGGAQQKTPSGAASTEAVAAGAGGSAAAAGNVAEDAPAQQTSEAKTSARQKRAKPSGASAEGAMTPGRPKREKKEDKPSTAAAGGRALPTRGSAAARGIPQAVAGRAAGVALRWGPTTWTESQEKVYKRAHGVFVGPEVLPRQYQEGVQAPGGPVVSGPPAAVVCKMGRSGRVFHLVQQLQHPGGDDSPVLLQLLQPCPQDGLFRPVASYCEEHRGALVPVRLQLRQRGQDGTRGGWKVLTLASRILEETDLEGDDD